MEAAHFSAFLALSYWSGCNKLVDSIQFKARREASNSTGSVIKLKSVVAISSLTDAQVTDKKFVSTVVKAFEALHPLIVFLNNALEV